MRFALYATVLAALAAPATALPRRCTHPSAAPVEDAPATDAPAVEATESAADGGAGNILGGQLLASSRSRRPPPTSWEDWQKLYSQYFPQATGGAPSPSAVAPTPSQAPPSQAPTNARPAPATTTTVKASAAAPSSAPQQESAAGAGSLAQIMVNKHNAERAKYGAGPVKWNQQLADGAAAYASKCIWQHSHEQGLGENLAASTNPDPSKMFDGWAAESQFYNFANPGPNPTKANEQIGHWTQIVWKGTTEIGCALQSCPTIQGISGWGGSYLICRYKSPGNVYYPTDAETSRNYAANIGNKV